MNRKNTHTILIILLSILFTTTLKSQDADDLLNDIVEQQPEYATGTFKASRIINGHSIEQPAANNLEFRISHRFGRINQGFYEWFGLDEANIHYSFEYGITDKLTTALGRSNYKKTYDGYVKYNIVSQGNFPFFITYLGSIEYSTLKNEIPDFKIYHRFSYVNQLLIARKFTKRLSLQVTPTYIHKNYVESKEQKNDIGALGIGGRFKITNQLSFNAETFLRILNDYDMTPGGTPYQIPISVGIDLETGGHVFQIMLTNSVAMREVGFITETTGKWSEGEIHLGFNISRTFSF